MSPLDVHEEIRQALAEQRAVVAVETAIVTHGLPAPQNLETAMRLERAIRQEGAVPATIGVIDGRLKVGLSPDELVRLARSTTVEKLQAHSLPWAMARRLSGGTTVSATITIAHRAGIRLVTTGGIGGVHRQVELSCDISQDLFELAHTPIGLVAAGAKVVLDLPRTAELLETLGVLTLGFQTDEWPAFYCRSSGLPLLRLETSEAIAEVLRVAFQQLSRHQGILICQEPPENVALPTAEVEALIQQALAAAAQQGIRGKEITPFLLRQLNERSGGRTVQTNIALAEANAQLASRIALHLGDR